MKEVWRPIPGYESLYEVSNIGRVRTIKTGLIRKPFVHHRGYLALSLYENDTEHRFYIHGLVAAAFIGPRPDGMTVNHIDGDKQNNTPSNLEYLTIQENLWHGHKLGLYSNCNRARGSRNGSAKLTENEVIEIKKLLRAGNMTYSEIAENYDVGSGAIGDIKRGHHWRHIKID